MSVVINGITGITAPGTEIFGDGTALGGATNPIVSMAKGANNYVQSYIVNNTNGTSSSADFVAYPPNGNDSHGWVDMGITSLNYADTTYTVTGPNESYLFGSGPTSTTGTGNLVIATDNTGTANAIQFYTNGFTQAKTAYAMQLDSSSNLKVAGTVSTKNTFGFKNRIINGAMAIDQRNVGASVTLGAGNPIYTLDRWAFQTSQASKLSIQQGAITNNFGFTNAMLATSLSAYSVGSTDYYTFTQRIEGYNIADLNWGTVNAKTVTLSFWVYSSLTGTFGGSIQNSAFNRSYPFSYTISSANTWTQISVTIAGDTTGTWLTTNGIGMYVCFGLGCGSTYAGTAGSWQAAGLLTCTGATSVVGTNGATWYITGVQLEVGSQATPFDTRPYTTELQLCQRYYWKQGGAAAGAPYQPAEIGFCPSTTAVSLFIHYPVRMRVNPSIGYGGSAPLITSFGGIVADQITIDQALLSVAGIGFVTGQVFRFLGNADTTTFISYTAEL